MYFVIALKKAQTVVPDEVSDDGAFNGGQSFHLPKSQLTSVEVLYLLKYYICRQRFNSNWSF